MLEASRGPVIFDARRLRSTQAWKGRRTVLVCYSIRSLKKLTPGHLAQLKRLGFRPSTHGESEEAAGGEQEFLSSIPRVAPPPEFHELTERFGLQAFEGPASAIKRDIEEILPHKDFLDGSLRVEPPANSVGSPRVEPAYKPAEPCSPPSGRCWIWTSAFRASLPTLRRSLGLA